LNYGAIENAKVLFFFCIANLTVMSCGFATGSLFS